MREVVLNKMMSFSNNGSYSNDELERMRYGFEALYIFITKSIVIFATAYFIGILKYTLIFLAIYGLIRSFACGIHAKKSWICLVFSGVLFIGLPYLSSILTLNIHIKIILNIFSLIIIYKYAPADTKKRPIVNRKKRKFLKITSLIIAITYISLSLLLKNEFICNSLIFSLLLESFMITPMVYKIAGAEYANYKNYNL